MAVLDKKLRSTMMNIEYAINNLKDAIIEMGELVIKQLTKSKDAYINHDKNLAEEIVHNEKIVNSMELSIDRDCERIFALLNPVASDLRFVIAALKINSDFERIGDYADGIADYILDSDEKLDQKLVESTNLGHMFDIAIAMTEDITLAIKNDDNVLARSVYTKDRELNEINSISSKIITDYIKINPDGIRQALLLFSAIRKLERAGDHVKNIAEDLIFYVEAKVLKQERLDK